MAQPLRSPYQVLTLLAGLGVVLAWGSVGVRAMVMDGDVSVRALVVGLATVLVGFATGTAVWLLMASRRMARPTDAAAPSEMAPAHVMLGLMMTGLGASAVLDASPPAWDWGLLVLGSLAGGLNLGVAFMATAAPSPASGSSAAAEARAHGRHP